jgi:signal transduction histidine kinase
MLADRVQTPLTILLSLCIHLAAALQFALALSSLSLPAQWLFQGLFLIFMSALLSLLQNLLRKKVMSVLLIQSARFLLLLVISYPMGRSIDVEMTLLVAIVFEIGLYTDLWISVIFSFLLIGAMLVFQGDHYVWRTLVPAPSLTQRVVLGVFPLLVLFLSATIRYYKKVIVVEKETIAQQKRAIVHTVETNLKLQDYIITREDEAAASERKRITRDIHDTVGHTLMSIILMMKAASRLERKADGRVSEFLAQTESQARLGMEDTRKALRILRTPESVRPTLVGSIHRLVKAFQGTFLKVRVEYSDIPMSFDETVDALLFRLVQEAITNSIRHGDADKVDIYFRLNEGEVFVAISDNGGGCRSFAPGIGLCGIMERLLQVNGTLHVPETEVGFTLIVRIPWNRKG